MRDVTTLVRAAIKYRVEQTNRENRGESTFSRWNAPLPPTDDLYRATGWEVARSDSAWIIRVRSTGEEVTRIPRELSARKTCLCYMEKMPKVPKLTY